MMMFYVIIALGTLSVGSAIPASCDDDPYEKETSGYYGTLKFLGSPNDGKYPHGTRVTLSCTYGLAAMGPKESQCSNGQWEPKLSRCSNGLDCLFGKEQEEWGYSGMTAPLEEKGSKRVLHARWAYFKCRNDSLHAFKCYAGQWKPAIEDSNRCGCAELKEEHASFTYSSPPNGLGRYDPGTTAAITCSGNRKPYGALNSTCTRNKWEPSPPTCYSSCGEDPYEKESPEQSNGHATLTFTNDPYDDGTYPHNTRVTLFCTSGSAVKGSKESVCSNGQWEPKLGRCPNWCSVEVLKERGIYVTGLIPYKGPNWQKHLGLADTSCYFPSAKKLKSLLLTCRDGEWDPPVSCPEAINHH